MWLWALVGCGAGNGEAIQAESAELLPELMNPCVATAIPTTLAPLRGENVEHLDTVATLCDPADIGTILQLEMVAGQLASVGERQGVQIWALDEARVRTMTVDLPLYAVQWVEEHGMLMLGAGNGEVFAVDFEGRRQWQASMQHEGPVSAVWARVEQGDVYSGGHDGVLNRWSLRDGRRLAQRRVGVQVADVLARDDEVVVTGEGVSTHGLDARSLVPGRSWSRDGQPGAALAVRPIAKHLAIGSERVTVWEGGLETRYDHPIEGTVQSMAYDPTGDLLAVGTDGGQLLIFDTTKRTLLAERRMPWSHQVLATIFADTGRFIATAGDGGVIRIWGVPRLVD